MTINQKVSGAAALTSSATAFSASVPGAGQTFTVASATGYPATGRFTVVLDLGTASEEKILCSSRSGTTFTVETRGYDDTTAQSHTNPTVALKLPATIITALIEHVDGAELAPHSTTLPVGTTAGHDTTTRHVFGAGSTALGVPGTPTTIQPDATGAAGSGARPAREDHTHAITTDTAVSVGTALSEGTAATFARSDHVHELGAGSIDTAAFFAAGVIPLTAIADALLTFAKFAAANPTDFAPSEGAFSSAGGLDTGTGGTTYGYYYKLGLLTVGWCGFRMESDGNVPSGNAIRIPVPFAQKALGTMRGFVAARTRADSGEAFSGTGVISQGNTFGSNIITAGSSAEWDATAPYNWGTPGVGSLNLDAVFFLVAAS